MLKKALLAGAAVIGLGLGTTVPAGAHNFLDMTEVSAGYLVPIKMRVSHGCKGSPVIGLRLKVPEGVTDAKASFNPFWEIEYKMRELDEPIMAHGVQVTESVDEIYWKNPVKAMPADGWTSFEFRMTFPDTPGQIMHFKNITVCEEGTDPYVDMPETELSVEDPEFATKVWDFMSATSGPAPFVVIRQPDKKQYPWEWTPDQARGEALTQ